MPDCSKNILKQDWIRYVAMNQQRREKGKVFGIQSNFCRFTLSRRRKQQRTLLLWHEEVKRKSLGRKREKKFYQTWNRDNKGIFILRSLEIFFIFVNLIFFNKSLRESNIFKTIAQHLSLLLIVRFVFTFSSNSSRLLTKSHRIFMMKRKWKHHLCWLSNIDDNDGKLCVGNDDQMMPHLILSLVHHRANHRMKHETLNYVINYPKFSLCLVRKQNKKCSRHHRQTWRNMEKWKLMEIFDIISKSLIQLSFNRKFSSFFFSFDMSTSLTKML